MTKSKLIAALIVGSFVLAGCGGGSSDSCADAELEAAKEERIAELEEELQEEAQDEAGRQRQRGREEQAELPKRPLQAADRGSKSGAERPKRRSGTREAARERLQQAARCRPTGRQGTIGSRSGLGPRWQRPRCHPEIWRRPGVVTDPVSGFLDTGTPESNPPGSWYVTTLSATDGALGTRTLRQ